MSSAVCSTDFDMHKLIAEVKTRPILWNAFVPEYSDKNAKVSAWREVCQVFLPTYESVEPSRKQEVCRTLQRKWKSLRDSFARELKQQTKESKLGSDTSYRKKYIFFDKLTFLRPTVISRKSSSKLNKSDHQEDETTEKEENTNETPENEFVFAQIESQHENIISKKRKVSRKRKLTKMKSAEMNILSEVSKYLKERRDEERLLDEMRDEDRLFLLSLVADLKKVPEEKKLDAKTEMMMVLQKWQRSSKNLRQNYCYSQHVAQTSDLKKEFPNLDTESAGQFEELKAFRSLPRPTQSHIISDILQDTSYS